MSRGVRAIAGLGMIVVGGITKQPWLVASGVSMLGGAVLERKPKVFGGNPRGQSVMVRSTTEPQPLIYGRCKKSGPLLWVGTYGAELRYLTYVIAIADGREIDGYESLWLDDIEINLATEVDGSGFVTKAGLVNADGTKLVKCGFYRGTPDQIADAELVAAFPEWTAEFTGKGTAYFWVRLEIDNSDGGNDPNNPVANVWSKGGPRDIAVTVRGFRVYDPRKDSTAGGTGAHRANDPTTWEWSQNPVLCMRDFLVDPRLGPGYQPATLPVAHYAAQANICDELVDIPGPATQPRYTLNGWMPVEGEPRPILESMLTACQGAYVDAEGEYKVYAGAWATPEHDIDESWLAGGLTARPSASGQDLYNSVQGLYVSRSDQWQQMPYPARTAAAYVTADGGRIWPRQLDLRWTTDPYEAQRIAVVELRRGRNQTVVEMICNRKAMVVAEWDVVRVSIESWGYFEKTFRCIHFADRPDGTIVLTLREETADSWEPSVPDLDTVTFGDPILRANATPTPVTSLAASTAPEGIRLSWLNGDMASVRHVEIYAAATNDRSTASLVQRTVAESWTHALAADTVRYYWALKRHRNGLVSTWHPAGATDGVYGIAGAAGQGPPGDPGAPALDGFVNVDGPASWVRAQDGSTWAPTATTTDVDWTFAIAGTAVARISRRVTRAADGLLTVSTTTHPGGDLNTGRVTITTTGGGTRAVTLRATYDHDGYTKTVVQAISAALSGADGAPGLSVAELIIYRRSASAPATPTGGSFNFGTQTLTPPTNWSSAIPAGTDPVYTSRAVASVVGQTGTASSLTWTAPALSFRDGTDGQAVDIIFRRSATQPATPAASSGVPSGWYSDVNSVPAGPEPLWSSVGTRTGAGSNWTWQVAVRVEGADGDPGTTALNAGWAGEHLDRWWLNHPITTPMSTNSAWQVAPLSGPVKPLGLRYNSSINSDIFSERISLTPGQRYRITLVVRQPTGSRTNYVMVAFYDADGNYIEGSTSDSVGWGALGSFHYHSYINQAFPAGWTTVIFDFGGDAAATVPTGAVSFAIGGLIAYGSAAVSTTVEINLHKVEMVAKDGASGLTANISNRTFSVQCDAGGVPLPGAFTNAVGQWSLFSGATDVTASATYSHTASSVTGSVNTATNVPVTGAKGSYRITAMSADQGYLEMTATYNGISIKERFTVQKVREGAASSSQSMSNPSNIGSSSYAVILGTAQIASGGGGTLRCAAAVNYTIAPSEQTSPTAAQIKIEYREAGGTWVTFPGAEATGTGAFYVPADLSWTDGQASITQKTTDANAAPRVYEFRLSGRIASGTEVLVPVGSSGFNCSWVP